MTGREIIQMFQSAERMGAEHDEPEGMRYIQISDTLAKRMIESMTALIERETDD